MPEYFGHTPKEKRTGFKHTNTRAIENRTNDGKRSRLTFYGAYMESNRLGDWQFSLSPEQAISLSIFLKEWAERKLAGEEISEPGIWYHDYKENALKVHRFAKPKEEDK